jgi:hypothetical protein
MKAMKYTLLIALAVIMTISGCKKKIEGELGTPYSKVAGMNGAWEIISFSQIDLNNPIQEERDLSKFYVQADEEPFTITFNSSERSYSVDYAIGKNFFGDEGTWSFDDDEFPSFLYMDDGINILEFEMGNVVDRYDNELSIELNRACVSGDDVTETVIYRFVFARK